MVEVTRQEFDDYIKNYPRKLETHFVGMINPPILEYHDFTLGNVPESCVARTNYWDQVDEYGVRYFGWLDLPEEERVYEIKY